MNGVRTHNFSGNRNDDSFSYVINVVLALCVTLQLYVHTDRQSNTLTETTKIILQHMNMIKAVADLTATISFHNL